VAAMVGLAALSALRLRGRLYHDPRQRAAVQRRYAKWRLYHLFGLLTVYVGMLYAVGWGWTARHLFSLGGQPLPGGELVVLAPFRAGLFLSWPCFYDVERAVHATALHHDENATPSPAGWPYVGLQIRHNLILVLPPLLLLIAQQSLLHLFPALEKEWLFPV